MNVRDFASDDANLNSNKIALEKLVVYIPMDRRHAMARSETLPDRTRGAALFADISGFTQLTEALVNELGPQRGAEELTNYLNLVYDAVIEELHRFCGSVIAFAGDAITCWLDGDDGLRATSCALSMQQAMQRFAKIQTPAGSVISLTMKAAVATGAVRRFVIGDPDIRVVDALAGETLVRLAAAEHQAQKGEVLLDGYTMNQLGNSLKIEELRDDPELDLAFGVVSALTETMPESPWPALATEKMDLHEIETWLLPSVYAQVTGGLEEFLAELRPTVALFLRFGGIDYDNDDDAGQKLNDFIRWVQSIVAHYEGTLIDLNIGDKGSYIYINFGAPLAHENNAAHAASAALALRNPPAGFGFMDPVQIGISQGRMRAGVYGGSSHRTYGVLGDEVNMAARLMMKAQPDQILVSEAAQQSIAHAFTLQALAPMTVKGKSKPVNVFSLEDKQLPQPGQSSSYSLPMVGRDQELMQVERLLEQAKQGHGQIIALVGEAGVGKSRFAAEFMHRARSQAWEIFRGGCESYGTNSSYLVWQPIWRGLFSLDAAIPVEDQIVNLTERLGALNSTWVQRLPLLDTVLQLPIPDNDLTRSLDAKVRKTSLESLLVDVLRMQTISQPTLIVLEDCDWLDQLSRELLQAIHRAVVDRPICVLQISRELSAELSAEIDAIAYASRFQLGQFRPDEAARLVQLKLGQLSASKPSFPESLVERLISQSQGNPFYLEELATYLYYQGLSEQNGSGSSQPELPDSLHRLVLSRLDQLSERQKITARVASVIGRVFRAAWLWGIYPQLGDPIQVHNALIALQQQDLTMLDLSESEPAYFFKQVITQNVTYESLPYAMRSTIHDQIGQFIEATYSDSLDQYLDLLAFHYDSSDNTEKRKEYLMKAAESAQAQYANQAAIDYYTRLLPLLSQQESIDVRLKLGQVLELTGQFQDAQALYELSLLEVQRLGDRRGRAWFETAMGELFDKQGKFDEAWTWLKQAQAAFEELGDLAGVGQVLHCAGTMAVKQGDYERALDLYQDSLQIRRNLGDERAVGSLLSNMGIVARRQGDLALAQSLFADSLDIRRKIGDKWGIAMSLINLGNIMLDQNRLEESRTYLEEAVALQREVGDRYMIGNALNNLGNVVRAQRDYATAHSLYNESLTIYLDLGDKWALAYLLEDVGWLVAEQDRGEMALRLVGAAAVLREEIGAPLTPSEKAKLDAALAPALVSINQVKQASAISAGRAMSLAQAIDYALSNGSA